MQEATMPGGNNEIAFSSFIESSRFGRQKEAGGALLGGPVGALIGARVGGG